MAQSQRTANGTASTRLRKPAAVEREQQQQQQRDRDRQLESDGRGRRFDRPGTPGSTQRSSFSSSPDRDRPIAQAARQTPKPNRSPFKSFRARLQAFGFGSDTTPPPSPVLPTATANGTRTLQRSGSLGRKSSRKEGQQSVRGKKVSGPIAVVPGGAARLKGYNGPAGTRKDAPLGTQAADQAPTAGGGIGKSASLPANLAGGAKSNRSLHHGGEDDDDEREIELDRKEAETFPPTLLWRPDEDVSEFGMRETRSPLSVDEYLASQVPAHSPPLVTTIFSSTAPGRRSPRPPIHISPRPDTLSPNPPASITRFLRSSTPDQQQLSPVMPPLVNRVSADFVRQVDEPPLSALRARQAAETEALRAANRNSRLLPGATLPSDFASQALVRSKTEGATPHRWRDQAAAYSGESNSSGRRVAGDAPSTPPGGSTSLRRSLSDSPMLPQSDIMLTAIAASASAPGYVHAEETRGFSLGRVAGRRKSSIKTHNRAVSVPTTRTEHSGYDSPSKPFPSEFEEVPVQRRSHYRATDSLVSPSTAATPHLPQIVEASPSTKTDASLGQSLVNEQAAQVANEHAPSPLLDLIEHLEANPKEEEPSPRTVPGGFIRADFADPATTGRHPLARQVVDESDAMEYLDETPLDYQRTRNESTHSSVAGGYPFPLAGYLDGSVPSRNSSVASPSGVHPGPPGYMLQTGNSTADHPHSPPKPKSPDSESEYEPSPARSPFTLGTPAGSRLRAADSPERSITMEQMEREIAQMEVELAAAGTPRSLYDSPFLSNARSPIEPDSPTASGSKVTPRTNRRWSLIEMEKAYERMKDLLAASSERRPSELEGDGRSPALQAVPEGASPAERATEEVQTSVRELSRAASPRQASVSPAKSVHSEAKSPSLRERRQLQKGEIPLGQSGGPLTIVADKPLPGLPAPTPSPARKPVPPYDQPPSEEPVKARKPSPAADVPSAEEADSPAKETSPPKSRASRESLRRTPSPPSSPPRTASPRAASEHEPDSTERAAQPEPTSDAVAAEPSTSQATLAHRRTGSEGGIRQLYLPLRNKSTRDSMASIAGLDEMLSELGSPVTEGPLVGSSLATPPPASPARDHRLPTSARSSRFSRYELRSGAGREMQRRLGQDEGMVAVEPLSPMRRVPPSRRNSGRASHKREKVDTALKRTGSPSSPTEDATTWYRMSPGRAKERRLSGDVDQGHLRTSGGSQHRAALPRPVLTATQVRTMDKLEIYLEYVTIRADLEKAELERAALLDALRETRATLADVRKQRDASERELSLLRSAPEPSPTGSDASTHAWRDRAQQALFDVEILRHELLESKAREAALRRPSTISNGITATLGLGAAHLASSNDSFSSEPSRTVTVTPAQVPFPALPATNGSPTLVMHNAPDPAPQGPAQRPASEQAIHREPKDSFASTFDSDASSRLSMAGLDFASPIMGQTIPGGGRGAKSSFGSGASPVKRSAVSPIMMGRSFSALGFPGAGKAMAAPRLAKTSTGTIATDSEQADRSFESTLVDGALRQRDADFLSDLTANAADLSPEDKRGQRTFAGSPMC